MAKKLMTRQLSDMAAEYFGMEKEFHYGIVLSFLETLQTIMASGEYDVIQLRRVGSLRLRKLARKKGTNVRDTDKPSRPMKAYYPYYTFTASEIIKSPLKENVRFDDDGNRIDKKESQ